METSILDSLTVSAATVLRAVALAAIATAVVVLVLWALGKLFRRTYAVIQGLKEHERLCAILERIPVLTPGKMTYVLIRGAKAVRFILSLLILYGYVLAMLAIFPWTRESARASRNAVLDLISYFGSAVLDYIPNLAAIAVILVGTRLLLKVIRAVFDAVEAERIVIETFHKEWARPTYLIVRFLILAFAFAMVFPYLPGAGSPAVRGLSIFLGVLFSLGSTSAMANVIAGIILTYMRPFHVGDRVRISDTEGDVIEKTLLVTRIQTIKNVEITVPNSLVLSSHIVNFSASARDEGLILHTTVTIGYDVPWRTVHELLVRAAAAAPNLLETPPPFVLQRSLDDYYVSYELNVYTDQPYKMAQTYDALHRAIQDAFNNAGVEIMSPAYSALRDGNTSTVPAEKRPPGYEPGAFGVRLKPPA